MLILNEVVLLFIVVIKMGTPYHIVDIISHNSTITT